MPVLVLQDQKANGTEGGTFTAGAWETRVLNTEVVDEIGSTLAANQFTLPAGDYFINAWVPAHNVGRHKARLRNITDGSTTILGHSAYVGSATITHSCIRGYFTLAAGKTFEIQHRCESTRATDGFGVASSFSEIEVYTSVFIQKR